MYSQELDPEAMESYPRILSQEVFLSPYYLHKCLFFFVLHEYMKILTIGNCS